MFKQSYPGNQPTLQSACNQQRAKSACNRHLPKFTRLCQMSTGHFPITGYTRDPGCKLISTNLLKSAAPGSCDRLGRTKPAREHTCTRRSINEFCVDTLACVVPCSNKTH